MWFLFLTFRSLELLFENFIWAEYFKEPKAQNPSACLRFIYRLLCGYLLFTAILIIDSFKANPHPLNVMWLNFDSSQFS